MSDKPSLSDWKYPSNPSSPNPNSNTGPPAPTSTRPVEVAHGRSSSTAFSSNPAHRPAPSTGKRALTAINEATSPGTSPSPAGFGKDLRHRTNASVFAAQMGGGARDGASFPTSPQQAVKMVYSNVRRRSLSDLAYSVLFVGSLLLFAYSVTGVGWDPTTTTKKALGRNTATAVRKAVEVKIPDSFLPNEAPPDVHQPLGDDSHDNGQDYLNDSPEDPKLAHDNAHRHVQTKDEALFANGHEDAEQELDKKLNREVTQEEEQAEAEAEPVVENLPEVEEDEEDAENEEEEEEEGEATASADDSAGDDDDDDNDDDADDEDEEAEAEAEEGEGEEEISADALDAESDVLSSHDHHAAAAATDPDAAPAAEGEGEDADAIVLEDGADGEGELDLLEEVTAGAEGAVAGEEEQEQEENERAQDGEGEAEGKGAEEDDDEDGLAALPEAARAKGAKRLKGISRMLR